MRGREDFVNGCVCMRSIRSAVCCSTTTGLTRPLLLQVVVGVWICSAARLLSWNKHNCVSERGCLSGEEGTDGTRKIQKKCSDG